jgi:hypothetical protein
MKKDILKIIEVDKTEYGILINALNEFRNKLIREEQDTELVDEFLLKVLDAPENKRYVDREGRLGAR